MHIHFFRFYLSFLLFYFFLFFSLFFFFFFLFLFFFFFFFFFFQAEDGIRDGNCDWSSDVCSSDLTTRPSRPRSGCPRRSRCPRSLSRWATSPPSITWRSSRSRRAARRTSSSSASSLTRCRCAARSEERRVGKGGRARWRARACSET